MKEGSMRIEIKDGECMSFIYPTGFALSVNEKGEVIVNATDCEDKPYYDKLKFKGEKIEITLTLKNKGEKT